MLSSQFSHGLSIYQLAFLLTLWGSFLIAVVKTVTKNTLFIFCSIFHSPFSLKTSFSVKKKNFLCFVYGRQRNFGFVSNLSWLVGWLVEFYGIPTFVSYLMPNLFSYKQSVLFQAIQFSMSIQFNCQKHFYFKLFSLVKQF